MDDLAREGDEGRGKQRYASGSRKQTLIRRFPNGGTRLTLLVISELDSDLRTW